MNPSSNKRLRIISQHLLESGSSIMGQPTSSTMRRVIVIGGGLAGLSAAHTILERGGRVLLLDKNPFMGGNSTKATSGINGAPTRAQAVNKIQDSVVTFEEDTALSASKGASKEIHPLGKVLVGDSGPAVEWLTTRFGLDLSIISRLGGHSFPRTHRGKEKFPGMTITYALMEKLEKLAKETPNDVEILLKSKATKLIYEGGEVIGVEYTHDGQTHSEYGPVVIATGGFASDFAPDGLLAKVHPEWLHLPTTNGEHCTGDGIKMIQAINGATIDLKAVQVHPTGLVHPDDPDAKVKWLAAEALRGVGGLVLDREGNRFCDELGRRDYVTGKMWEHNKGPYYLVLNSKASKSIEWHCKHYQGRGLMKFYNNANDFAKDTKIPIDNLKQTFQKFNGYAQKPGSDPFGLKFYDSAPYSVDDTFYVAIITPVLHYTMGGVKIDTEAAVLNEDGSAPIPGVFAGGEVAGGIHGLNRLGGSSLLDCVVFGRVAGASAAKYLLQKSINNTSSTTSHQSTGGVGPQSVTIQVRPEEKRVTLEFQWDGDHQGSRTTTHAKSQPVSVPVDTSVANKAQKSDTASISQETTKPQTNNVDKNKEISLDEIAKHNKNDDCWVAINGQVLDATNFLDDHPGGRKAIMLYAGKDASEEFNMLHEANVIEKYAPQTVIGKLKK